VFENAEEMWFATRQIRLHAQKDWCMACSSETVGSVSLTNILRHYCSIVG